MTLNNNEALWIVGRGKAEIRSQAPAEPADAQVRLTALYSGISRGTERLVFEGRVPPSQYGQMRAPFQEGEFPAPVKYGYSLVSRIDDGPAPLRGCEAFVLHPHQRQCAVPADAAIPLPDGVPAERAILAANLETALNALWDSGAGPGDRIAVIGAGTLGCLVSYLAARLPGSAVTLADINPARADIATAIGTAFTTEARELTDCDLVFHASASAEGLAAALAAAGPEATVVELSWYGDAAVPAPLGEDFHSKRLTLKSSQVGAVPPARAPRWAHRRRLETALSLLADPALDILISGETRFEDLPGRYGAILSDPATLCHRIVY